MPENYHPKICKIITFIFALIYENTYKVHGLWPNSCSECIQCGYPTCCQKVNFNDTIRDIKFIENYWLDGLKNNKHIECNLTMDNLYKYEFVKHGSCMDSDINNYINTVSKIYYQYENQFDKLCKNQTNCNLIMNSNYEITNITFDVII